MLREYLLTDPANGNASRRRRSWYRRRLRNRRILGTSILVAVIAAFCWQNAANLLHWRSLSVSEFLPESSLARRDFRAVDNLVRTSLHSGRRKNYLPRIEGVYPYSLVPGGVKNPESLREIAAHDRAIARHYARFDYNKAHIVRLSEPLDVYVSYRIRDTIFWTRKRIRLPAGEMLLTDGNMSLRAKCGNQISTTPQPEVSDQEPDEAVLDQPVAMADFVPPLHPPAPNLPAGAPMASPEFSGGFSFPLVALGGAAPVSVCRYEDGAIDKKCRAHKKPPKTSEPAAILLIASGLAMVFWRYQSSRRPLAV